MTRVLFVFGTRPEAIKMAPVIRQLAARPEFTARVCVTGQHRHMLDQVLDAFDISPDHDLDIMAPGQTLFASTARILAALEPVLDTEKPDLLLVQGDTTTTLCGALAGFYRRIPVGHIEAGLRTGDMRQPFPEEMNRVLTSRLATLHFAPTEAAAANLFRERVPGDHVMTTGNTGVDAVLYIEGRIRSGALAVPAPLPNPPPGRKLLLVTAHRRESFGRGLKGICEALTRIASRSDVHIVYPVHPNPNVRDVVRRALAHQANICLIEPLDYISFVNAMSRAYLIITDSGGVQEEAPSLGKPLLVLREKTERPEAVEAGTVRLTGTCPNRIVAETDRLLDDAAAYAAMTRVHNPYGDGSASERIAGRIVEYFAGTRPPR